MAQAPPGVTAGAAGPDAAAPAVSARRDDPGGPSPPSPSPLVTLVCSGLAPSYTEFTSTRGRSCTAGAALVGGATAPAVVWGPAAAEGASTAAAGGTGGPGRVSAVEAPPAEPAPPVRLGGVIATRPAPRRSPRRA